MDIRLFICERLKRSISVINEDGGKFLHHTPLELQKRPYTHDIGRFCTMICEDSVEVDTLEKAKTIPSICFPGGMERQKEVL